jgi:hypothetical protein
VPLASRNFKHWCSINDTTRYLCIHGLPRSAEYEVLASMTKKRTLKVNVDIWGDCPQNHLAGVVEAADDHIRRLQVIHRETSPS